MKGWITINTDAGWLPRQKVGSFAYWIKSDNLHLHGSGMLKGTIKNSDEAETKAIVNALHVLLKSNPKEIVKIVINRDNINAVNQKKGRPEAALLHSILVSIWRIHGRPANIEFNKFFEFRHVKAHGKGEDSRGWVNNWCDAQCKARQIEWLKNNNKNEAKKEESTN